MNNLFIFKFFKDGGILMIPLALCSIYALAIVIERLRFYKFYKSDSEEFMNKVKKAIKCLRFSDALLICRQENTPLANVIAAGIDNFNLKKEDLMDVMRREGLVQLKKYEKNLNALSTIATITPQLGLAGTITGMIAAFGAIQAVGAPDSAALAGGISEALYTTAAGLLIGIPALAFYNWASAKADTFAEQVEFYASELASLSVAMEVEVEKLVA